MDNVRGSECSDLLAHGDNQLLLEGVGVLNAVVEGDIGVDTLSLHVVVIADHCCLGALWVGDERALNLSRADAVSAKWADEELRAVMMCSLSTGQGDRHGNNWSDEP